MNRSPDVIEVLRRANPVPVATVDETTLPAAPELTAMFRALHGVRSTVSLDAHRAPRPQRWPAYAAVAAVLAAVVAGLVLVPRNQDDTVDPADTVGPATTADTVEPASTASPSGDTIAVTANLIDFGDRLVGLIGNMDRADGRTYVLGGHYQTEGDLLRAPEEAVLAAFDDGGRELWRIELDGTPVRVAAVGDDVWILHEAGTLSRIDSSDGRVVDQMNIPYPSSLVAGFGSVWIQTSDFGSNPAQLIRVDPDLSTTTVELPVGQIDPDNTADEAAAGAGAIWVPRGAGGVAVIDPVSLEVTVIGGDVVGHDVLRVAFDGDVAYVASRHEVTAVVGREVRATTVLGELGYLGRVEGVFGALTAGGFVVLGPDDPMKLDVRRVSVEGPWGPREIDGEAWVETGRNYDLTRVEFVDPEENGG